MIKAHFRVASEKERKERQMVDKAMALDLFEDNHLIMTIFPDFYRIDKEIAEKVYFNSVKEDIYLTYAPGYNC